MNSATVRLQFVLCAVGSVLLALQPAGAEIVDFDSLADGTPVASGTGVGGATLVYSIDGLSMQVTDQFSTTSSPNSLGLANSDKAFLDGDTFTVSLSQPAVSFEALFTTSDPALAGEILLVTSADQGVNRGTADLIMPDGGYGYLVEVVSNQAFSTVDVAFADDGEVNFVFTLDDITFVPEPSAGALAGGALGIIGLLARSRNEREPTRRE